MGQKSVILMGLRGSGKTTLAPLVAARVGHACSWIDLDQEVARLLGTATPGEGLSRFGEGRFREAECDALAHLLTVSRSGNPPLVLALGGGTPTHEPSRALLIAEREAGRAVLVYLWSPATVLRLRLSATDMTGRPALLGKNPLDEIDELLRRRDPLYRSMADVVLDVSALGMEHTTDAILAAAGIDP